uniref:TICAM-b n=1 Tax=Lethenteron camtschaticum TaxID=980415 RepID=A0A8G0YL97_LETCA|nr:TICAM-b [Lethenteron camtschaticum]UPO71030.1 TRIF [Eudontomyzon morii]
MAGIEDLRTSTEKDIDTLIRQNRPHLKDWIGYAPDRFIDELDRNDYIDRSIYHMFKDMKSTNKIEATNYVLNWLYDGGIKTQVKMLKALQRVEDHYPRVKRWLKDVDARSLIARADEDALAAERYIASMPSPLSIRMPRGVVSETRDFVDGAVSGQGEGNVGGHSGAIPKKPHQSFIDIHAKRQGVGQSGQAGPMVGSKHVEKLATEIGNLQLRSEPWSRTAGKETDKFPVVQEDRSDSYRAPRVEEGQNDEDDFCSFVILHHEDDGDAARQVKNDLERFGVTGGAVYEDEFQVGGFTHFSCLDNAINKSVFIILLLTNNFRSKWNEFVTHVTLMNSIQTPNKNNTIIPLYPRENALPKHDLPMPLRALASLDQVSTRFESQVKNTFSIPRIREQRRRWSDEQALSRKPDSDI